MTQGGRNLRRVFIASTYAEFGDQRTATAEAVRQLDVDVGTVEVFAATPEAPLSTCYRMIEQSDAVIVLSGVTIGEPPSVDAGGDGRRSFTWLEVEHARNVAQVPVFVFLSGATRAAPEDYPARAFNEWLQENFLASVFDDTASLAYGVVVALARHFLRPQLPRLEGSRRGVVQVHDLAPGTPPIGRSKEIQAISDWHATSDAATLQIAGIGGAGKSTLAAAWLEQELGEVPAGTLRFTWSFGERADSQAFLRSLSTSLSGSTPLTDEEIVSAIVRELDDGHPHLMLVDGLDRIVHRDLRPATHEDVAVVRLLEQIDAGIGAARMIVTSRFSLAPLLTGPRIEVRGLTDDDARALIRTTDPQLAEATVEACLTASGNHPLALRALGSLIRHFGSHDLDPELLSRVPAESDSSAGLLANVLAQYTQSLTTDERDLMAVVSAFPRGLPLRRVSGDGRSATLIRTDVSVVGPPTRVRTTADTLLTAGLLEEHTFRDAVMVTAPTPFRNWFRPLFGMSDDTVAQTLAVRLGSRPATELAGDDHGTDFLLGQLSMPAVDWIAPWTAWWFNLMNVDANVAAVASLELPDTPRVLDLGFGGGVGLRAVLDRFASAMVDGVDASYEMVRVACETFADEIRAGGLRLHHCEVGTQLMPFPTHTFDAVVSVCTVPFWRDVRRVLNDVWRVLRPGGALRLVVETYRIEYLLSFPRQGFSTLRDSDVVGLLAASGFVEIGAELVPGSGGSYTLLTARTPAT